LSLFCVDCFKKGTDGVAARSGAGTICSELKITSVDGMATPSRLLSFNALSDFVFRMASDSWVTAHTAIAAQALPTDAGSGGSEPLEEIIRRRPPESE